MRYLNTRIQVLLLRANSLGFRAENLSHDELTIARAKALISPHRLSSSLLSTAPFEDGKLSVVLPRGRGADKEDRMAPKPDRVDHAYCDTPVAEA